MKTLFLTLFLLCSSLTSYAQFGLNVYTGLTAKAIVNFKNGTREIGTVKENSPLFAARRNDPDELKFKNNGAEEYRLISSADISSILVYNVNRGEDYMHYYPIRVRSLSRKGEFKDDYYVDYFPLFTYKSLSFVRIQVYFNGKYNTDHFLFPVENTDYYFGAGTSGGKIKGTFAEPMINLDPNCPELQEFIQTNYLDSNQFKVAYQQELKAFKANKEQFLAQCKADGMKTREAKVAYKSEEQFIFTKMILDKYLEFCKE